MESSELAQTLRMIETRLKDASECVRWSRHTLDYMTLAPVPTKVMVEVDGVAGVAFAVPSKVIADVCVLLRQVAELCAKQAVADIEAIEAELRAGLKIETSSVPSAE